MSLTETTGTTVPDSLATPTKETSRLHSLDTTRGFALMAILLMNIWAFSMPFEAYINPNAMGGMDGWNLQSWFISGVVFEGTARGLFSLLFGAGFILMLDRLEGLGMKGMEIYARRLVWLLIFGMIHSYILLWLGDILYAYAVMGFLLLAYRSTKPRTFILLTVVLLVLQIARFDLLSEPRVYEARDKAEVAQTLKDNGEELNKEQEGALKKWANMQKPYKQEDIDDAMKAYQGSYSDAFSYAKDWSERIQSLFIYRGGIFGILTMFFIGAALMKLGFWQQGFSNRNLWLMVIVGYGIGMSARYYYVQAEIATDFDIYSRMAYGEFYNIWRVLVTIGHLGLLTLFGRSGWLGWLQKAVGNVGRMALSNYICHTIIASIYFYGAFMGNFGKLERVELYPVVAVIWVFNLVFSTLWLKYYYYGPLEWLWRALTYGERPKMKRV